MSGFKLLPKNTIRTKVTIKEPLDFGKFNTVNVDVTWKTLTTSEQKEMRDRLSSEGPSDKELLQELVVNVDGFLDADGNKQQYSDELLDQALEYPCVLTAFALAMTEQLFGKRAVEEARRKN